MMKTLCKAQADQSPAGSCRDRLIVAMTVRMARAALGWSQCELALHLGMSQRGIHRIEQGHSMPRRVTLLAIEALFTKAGLKIEERSDGGFCISVSASVLDEAGMPVHVTAPSLSDPSEGEGEGVREGMEAAPSELLR